MMQYIEAQVEYAKEEAIVSTLRTQLASQQSCIHQDSHSLRWKSAELAEELKDLSLDVQKCLSEVIALHEFCSLIEHEHPNKGFSLDSMDDSEF